MAWKIIAFENCPLVTHAVKRRRCAIKAGRDWQAQTDKSEENKPVVAKRAAAPQRPSGSEKARSPAERPKENRQPARLARMATDRQSKVKPSCSADAHSRQRPLFIQSIVFANY